MARRGRVCRFGGFSARLFPAAQAGGQGIWAWEGARDSGRGVRGLDFERLARRAERSADAAGDCARAGGRRGGARVSASRRARAFLLAQLAARRRLGSGIHRLLHGVDAAAVLRPGNRPYRAADGLHVSQRRDSLGVRAADGRLDGGRDGQLLLFRLLDDGRAERAFGRGVQRVLQPRDGADPGAGGLRRAVARVRTCSRGRRASPRCNWRGRLLGGLSRLLRQPRRGARIPVRQRHRARLALRVDSH